MYGAMLNAIAGSVLRKRQTSRTASFVTNAQSSPPRPSYVSTTPPGNFAAIASMTALAIRSLPLASGGERRRLAVDDLVALRLDLLLQQDEAVEHLLRPRRAPRDVDVDRDDVVDALHRRVVVVEAAGAGADAERHHPLRLAHLLVDALQDRRLLAVDRADHHQH